MTKDLKDNPKLTEISAKLAMLETPQGKAQLAQEKLSELSAIPEDKLSDSMRWLVGNLKQRWQAQDANLIALEKQFLQAQKAALEVEPLEKLEI